VTEDGTITRTLGGAGEVSRATAASVVAERLAENVSRVVHGKDEQVRLVVAVLAAGGHVLLHDVPGTAKTILARALAGSVEGAEHSRIQCTPDLQPTDVTGLSVFDPSDRAFRFQAGPIFANVLLVDEINRATPRTQSAFLEAMAESQVTVDGKTRQLPEPFLVIATENPIEYEGTFPLPEAQLDRFFVRASLGYPDEAAELQVVREQQHGHPIDRLQPVVGVGELLELRGACEDVYVDPLLEEWIVQLVRATRTLDGVDVGASVRGSLALVKTMRGRALAHGRDHVLPEDLHALFVPVLGHRMVLGASFLSGRRGGLDDALEAIRDRCLEQVPPPRPDWAPGTLKA
jgi:MoxR-like ATPase